jgi:hypothetical protein
MILLDDVVQILDLPDLYGRFPLSVDGLQGGQISPAFVGFVAVRLTEKTISIYEVLLIFRGRRIDQRWKDGFR